jgi:hypothetical protein
MTTDNDIAIAAVNVAATTASALYAAVAKAQAHARGVEKDSTNTFHRYKYASAESLIAEAKDALAVADLGLIPQRSWVEKGDKPFGEIEGKGGSVGTLHAHWLLVHAGGGVLELETQWPVTPEKGRPIDKAVAAARTASLGYLLRDLLQLPRVEEGTGLDDDNRDDGAAQRKREMEEAKARAMSGGSGTVKAAKPDEDEARVKGAVVAALVKRGITDRKAQGAEVAKVNGGAMPADTAAWRVVLAKLNTANDPASQPLAA